MAIDRIKYQLARFVCTSMSQLIIIGNHQDLNFKNPWPRCTNFIYIIIRIRVILEESICLIGKECHRFHGSEALVEKLDSLKAVISKVESMGVILTDINLLWGTWTQ